MMKTSKKQLFAVAIAVAIAAMLAILILMTGKSGRAEDADAGHGHAAENQAQHGGKLYRKNDFTVEMLISGAEPEMRIYTYLHGKALPPADNQVSVTLERLGQPVQRLMLIPEKDYLKSLVVVEEPHSFKIGIQAQYGGQTYVFNDEQIEGRVSISDAQVQQYGVEVAKAGPARVANSLSLAAEIHLNQDKTLQIVPRLAGQVKTVLVNAGEQVQKGQLLAVISSQAAADWRSDAMSAQKRHALARSNYEREKKLWEEKISAEQDYLTARHAMQEAEITMQSTSQKLSSLGLGSNDMPGKDLSLYEIRSPIAGTVTEKHLASGQIIKEDSLAFTVADLSTVWVEMNIAAKDLNLLKPGQPALIKALAFAAESQGKLSYVDAVIGEQSRTATARIVLPNPQGIWRPGLPVQVELVTEEQEVAVSIALDALQNLNEVSTVFVRYGDAFEARPIKLGRRDRRHAEVLKGLAAGESYAAKNSYLIKAELGKARAEHAH